MLTSLSIKNFVLVDNSRLSLDKNFIAITGETGAGKSILLNALALTLGERANKLAIREGEEKAEVVAEFDISANPEARAVLDELEIDLEQDSNFCYLRRIVRRNDISKSWINGTACKLEQMRSLASCLIHIYGQHDSQQLLSRESQIKLYDQYIGCTKLTKQAAELFKTHNKLIIELEQLQALGTNPGNQLEYLRFQLEELDKLGVEQGEFDRLSKQQSDLRNNYDLAKTYAQLQELIGGDEGSLLDIVGKTISTADNAEFDNEVFTGVLDLLHQSKVYVEEANERLRIAADNLEVNPEEVEYIEQRLSKIYQIARKHEVEPNVVSTLVAGWRDKIVELEQKDAQIAVLQQKIKAFKSKFIEIATQLHAKRQHKVNDFNDSINRYLFGLGMADSRFEVSVKPLDFANANQYGTTALEFTIRANAGSTFYPLRRIASGGELSRVCLAIALTTCENSSKVAMVFDEIDSGVGGQTAVGIAKLLAQLGRQQQVLCITHLAQVAALSKQQFRVIKNIDVTRSQVHITNLDARQKIVEIARMTGGGSDSEQALELAKQMINS